MHELLLYDTPVDHTCMVIVDLSYHARMHEVNVHVQYCHTTVI